MQTGLRACGDMSAACEIVYGLRFVSSLKRLYLGSVEGGLPSQLLPPASESMPSERLLA